MDSHWVWMESPNSPEEAQLMNSRYVGSHQLSKENIQGENDLKFQSTTEMSKTSNIYILKKVKTRDYKEIPRSLALSNFSYFRCLNKIYQQLAVWYLRRSVKILYGKKKNTNGFTLSHFLWERIKTHIFQNFFMFCFVFNLTSDVGH